MVIFHSYVKLPEGNRRCVCFFLVCPKMTNTNLRLYTKKNNGKKCWGIIACLATQGHTKLFLLAGHMELRRLLGAYRFPLPWSFQGQDINWWSRELTIWLKKISYLPYVSHGWCRESDSVHTFSKFSLIFPGMIHWIGLRDNFQETLIF